MHHYPSEKADSLEYYVRQTFRFPRTAQHVYGAIRWLERQKRVGLCKMVFVGYREIAEEAHIDVKSVRKALEQLQMTGLVEVVFGSPIKTLKLATSIRRKTLDEIKALSRQGEDDASRLAKALFNMKIRFGDKIITPSWSVGRTGRVCSSKPNIQGKNHAERLAGLKGGLTDSHVLVYADIEKAEPTIVKHLLKIPKTRDLYRQYMDATGSSRPVAKKAINMLNYCRDSRACFSHWPEQAQVVLSDYVQKLVDYKKDLVLKARKEKRVATLTGRIIVTEKGRRLHAGHPMNWRIQGTVADLVNFACLRLLSFASVVLPEHDGIYAIVPKDKVPLVKGLLMERAREMGLPLTVKAEVWEGGLAVPETPTRESTLKPVNLCPKPPPITTLEGRIDRDQ